MRSSNEGRSPTPWPVRPPRVVCLVAAVLLSGCCSEPKVEPIESLLKLRLVSDREVWKAGEPLKFTCTVHSDSRYPLVFAMAFDTGANVDSQPLMNLEIESLSGETLTMTPDPDLSIDGWVTRHDFASLDPGATVTIYPRKDWEFPWLPSWRPAPGRYRARMTYDSSHPAEAWMFGACGDIPPEIPMAIRAAIKVKLASDWIEFSVVK